VTNFPLCCTGKGPAQWSGYFASEMNACKNFGGVVPTCTQYVVRSHNNV